MHTAIFDIGKTNKKFFVFNEQLEEIHREYIKLPETVDEAGFPTEDLDLLTGWMQETLQRAMQSGNFNISKLNFSTYGASFVHIGTDGKPVTPLYNYLKPFPEHLWDKLFAITGSTPELFWTDTASPQLGMLNSGLQLFWLQQEKPEVFKQIKYSLHFPQYLSYLFSGELQTEYTSLGCHTALWDFKKHDYHAWVQRAGIAHLFPKAVSATKKVTATVNGQEIEVGTGIHDSSAALLPYLEGSKEPFLLLSTGTWNIVFNPFTQDVLTQQELNTDCLNYMRLDGEPVKACRLFFGNEFNVQTVAMAERFHLENVHRHDIKFDRAIYQKWADDETSYFHLEGIQYPDNSLQSAPETRWDLFSSYEEAYHRFMMETTRLQYKSIRLAAGSTPVQKLYIDGGFSQNDVFINLLRQEFPGCDIIVSDASLGSSLGAAMAVNQKVSEENFPTHVNQATHE